MSKWPIWADTNLVCVNFRGAGGKMLTLDQFLGYPESFGV